MKSVDADILMRRADTYFTVADNDTDRKIYNEVRSMVVRDVYYAVFAQIEYLACYTYR